MARPQRNSPEKFGRLDGLLPRAEGKIEPGPQNLPRELDIDGLPEGRWIARGVYRMEREFEYGRWYGKKMLASPEESGRVLCHWGGNAAPVFLDTETTGLSGGTGTYAFLIGLGLCGAASFRVVQLFLAGPAWEKSWLAAIEAELPERYGLVTYNGRAFDLPLLRTRYTLARAVPSWNGAQHMDLLTLSRHFYKGRLSSCSLSSIERNVLGLRRGGEDVPGSEIPWMYTQFLRTQDAGPLRGIFYHNTLDIVSLAALQIHIAEMARGECSCGYDTRRRPLGREGLSGGGARGLGGRAGLQPRPPSRSAAPGGDGACRGKLRIRLSLLRRIARNGTPSRAHTRGDGEDR